MVDDIYRSTPGKRHDKDQGAYSTGHYDVSKYITVPCRVLLVPVDGYFSGGASMRAMRQSRVIGWRDLFYERSISKKVIVPIMKKAKRITSGTASVIYDGNITTAFSDSEQRKLKLITQEIRELVKITELKQRNLTSNLKGTLKREFGGSYLELALNSKMPVLYSNLELRLPLL